MNLSDVFTPMPGKVVIRRDDLETAGGLILPFGEKDQTLGTVVAVYQDFWDPELEIEAQAKLTVGDKVVFGKHSGTEVTLRGAGRETIKVVILREHDVLTRVNPEFFKEGVLVDAI